MSLSPTMDVTIRMARENREIAKAVFRAAAEEAKIETREMRARTPVDTGALVETVRDEIDEDAMAIKWMAGGDGVDYAVEVHENLEAFHPRGQARFIASVMEEAAAYLGARIATRARRILEASGAFARLVKVR